MSTVPVFVGIDISKDRLDIALRPTGEREAVPNTEPDIAALVARLQACHPTLIVLEATGGFELAVTAALAAARPRCGAILVRVKRWPVPTLVPRARQAPDGLKQGGTQPTDISRINRRECWPRLFPGPFPAEGDAHVARPGLRAP